MAEMIHYSAITECHDSLRKRAADDKSSVYKAIEQAFDEDLQVRVKYKQDCKLCIFFYECKLLR